MGGSVAVTTSAEALEAGISGWLRNSSASVVAAEKLTTEKRLFSDARLVITTVARVATALVG